MNKTKSSELILNENNPRKISKKNFERLKKSISENVDFFEARPVLANRKADGKLYVIGGHQRLKAAIELGMEYVPCFIFDNISDEKAEKYMLLDNSNEGEWDFKKLTDLDFDLTDINVKIPESIDYSEVTAKCCADAIMYKPSDVTPPIDELIDATMFERIAQKVESIGVPAELKDFVEWRMQIFKRPDWAKIADFYAHSEDEKVRALFRELGLVFDVTGTEFEKDLFEFYNVGLNEVSEIYE